MGGVWGQFNYSTKGLVITAENLPEVVSKLWWNVVLKFESLLTGDVFVDGVRLNPVVPTRPYLVLFWRRMRANSM